MQQVCGRWIFFSLFLNQEKKKAYHWNKLNNATSEDDSEEIEERGEVIKRVRARFELVALHSEHVMVRLVVASRHEDSIKR